MEDEPSTSMGVKEQLPLPVTRHEKRWTKSLKNIPSLSYTLVEEHLILASEKTPDQKPAEALKHKKSGYRLFKAGYATQIWVKSDVKKGDKTVHFLVRCQVSAEMRKKEYLVYVHLDQISGNIEFAKCHCPAGAGGRCKHVAAILFQLLDFIELELTEIPDDRTCTQELQQWHVPKKSHTKDAVLFEDLIFPQDSYEKDKKDRKRRVVEGKREGYSSTKDKVKKHDLEKLKSGLETARSNCPLIGLLADNKCIPSDSDVSKLPSRQRMLHVEVTKNNLESTAVRSHVVSKLTENTDFSVIPEEPKCTEFVKNRLLLDQAACTEIEKNTRTQSNCTEWYDQRKCRLTSSIFGYVVNRRKTIYPKSIVNKVIKSTRITKNASCQWGIDNEHTALLQYYDYKHKNNLPVEICCACGLIVNPKWPWLGSSPDALAYDPNETNNYGAVEVKCPASKANLTITEACNDNSFFLEIIDSKPSLKKRHVYFFQCQGVMAICQLSWLDFVVFTKNELHVERIYFNEHHWKENTLPQLTAFYFDYLMDLV